MWGLFSEERREKFSFKHLQERNKKKAWACHYRLAETEPHKGSPESSGNEEAGASASQSTQRKRKQNPSVPLPHCPPNPAAAIAATTMPKRKKQNQQQQPPLQQPPLPEREETGDEEDGSPIGEEPGRGVHMPVSWSRQGDGV